MCMTLYEGICSWGEITQNVYNLAQFLKLRFTYTTSFHNASDGTVTTARKWLVSKQTMVANTFCYKRFTLN